MNRKTPIRIAMLLWGMSFLLIWGLAARADSELFLLAPLFFLPQFAFTASLAYRAGENPWPWAPFLVFLGLGACVAAIDALFIPAAFLEAFGPPSPKPAALLAAPAAVFPAFLAAGLRLRQRARRRAVLPLLAAITGLAGAALAAGVLLRPVAAAHTERFLPDLAAAMAIAAALATLLWLLPAWIA